MTVTTLQFRKAMMGSLALVLLSSTAAYAAVSEKDVKVMAKSIGFIEGGPKGALDVVAVTDGGASKADADAFVALAGKAEGDVTFKASVIAPAALAGSNAKVVYIPAGMSGSFDAIFNAAKTKKFITISNAAECTAAQKCAISVASDPKVDINVSKSAATATGVTFGSAFSMMIKEQP